MSGQGTAFCASDAPTASAGRELAGRLAAGHDEFALTGRPEFASPPALRSLIGHDDDARGPGAWPGGRRRRAARRRGRPRVGAGLAWPDAADAVGRARRRHRRPDRGAVGPDGDRDRPPPPASSPATGLVAAGRGGGARRAAAARRDGGEPGRSARARRRRDARRRDRADHGRRCRRGRPVDRHRAHIRRRRGAALCRRARGRAAGRERPDPDAGHAVVDRRQPALRRAFRRGRRRGPRVRSRAVGGRDPPRHGAVRRARARTGGGLRVRRGQREIRRGRVRPSQHRRHRGCDVGERAVRRGAAVRRLLVGGAGAPLPLAGPRPRDDAVGVDPAQ